MSRTRNISKHEFNKEYGTLEFPNGYNRKPYNINPGDEYDGVDPTHSTFNDNSNPWQSLTRHPNKKKKRSLNREFKTVGLSNLNNWKNRFGNVFDKSSRTRGIRRELAQARRNRLKHDAKEEIERALDE